jgi:hypothetical protein
MSSLGSLRKSNVGFMAAARSHSCSSMSLSSGIKIITRTCIGPIMGRGSSRCRRRCSSIVPMTSNAFKTSPISYSLLPLGVFQSTGCNPICRTLTPGPSRSRDRVLEYASLLKLTYDVAQGWNCAPEMHASRLGPTPPLKRIST